MIPILIALAAALIVLVVIIWRLRSQTDELRRRLSDAGPFLIRSGKPFEILEPLLNFGEWVQIASGGQNKPGKIGGKNLCPCQSEYTCETDQVVINAWPNPQQVAACNANPPAPEAAGWDCKEDCVQVMTHIWHGFSVVKSQITGQLRFNCNTFAQYHCKKPTDPERDKPPKPRHPDDPEPIL